MALEVTIYVVFAAIIGIAPVMWLFSIIHRRHD
jgi:hypothetical protein